MVGLRNHANGLGVSKDVKIANTVKEADVHVQEMDDLVSNYSHFIVAFER